MDDHPAGRKALSHAVAQSAPHQIVVCKACTHMGGACRPGLALLKELRAAISVAGLGQTFEVSGTACLPGCVLDHGQPCVVGWRATETATWLFGDIDPDQPLDDLVEFARAHGRDLPQPGPTNLARTPAAMIVTREGVLQ